MAYINREKLIRDLIDNRSFYPAIVKNAIENAPTEDVVPRSEVEELRKSVDDALKLLGIESKKVKKLQKQLAPFREIGCETCKHYGTGFDHMPCYRCRDYNEYVWLSADVETIEKKYIGDTTDGSVSSEYNFETGF